jgi:hypothetical protein
MTSKTVSYVTLAVGALLTVLPDLVTWATGAGYPVWAHWFGVAIVVLTLVKQTLAPSVSDKARIAAAAEVPGAVAKVNNAVNDKIRNAATPAEGVPKL